MVGESCWGDHWRGLLEERAAGEITAEGCSRKLRERIGRLLKNRRWTRGGRAWAISLMRRTMMRMRKWWMRHDRWPTLLPCKFHRSSDVRLLVDRSLLLEALIWVCIVAALVLHIVGILWLEYSKNKQPLVRHSRSLGGRQLQVSSVTPEC